MQNIIWMSKDQKKVGSIIYSKEINMSKVKSYIWMISKDMKKKVNGKESNMKIV